MGERIKEYRKRLLREAAARVAFKARVVYAHKWSKAPRKGQEWTLSAIDRLQGLSDLTSADAASILGRTPKSVQKARRLFGR